MLLLWLGCLSKAELSKVEDHILCPAVWCKKEVGCFSGQDAASHNLKLQPVLQKSPLAFPLHKFHQSDQSERIAFRASFFHSHSGVWTHTHTDVQTQTHSSTLHKSVFTWFSIALHTCQNTVQISWKSLISTGLTVHQFFMSKLKLNRQWRLEKAKPAYYCSGQRSFACEM